MASNQNRIKRSQSNSLNKILGTHFKVLDDGFVRVIDYMGTDESIVQAARVSYGKGTKKVSEDRGLIRYLMRNRHTTPFEMCELKLHVRVPMDCWRQWIRHRTASINEYSTRYSIAINAAKKTDPKTWRLQSKSNKQGSSEFLSPGLGRELTKREAEIHEMCREVYEHRIECGVAREQARKDLPLSTYTEAYWKIDLHNLLHFLSLRMDIHAQHEIREYANIIGNEIVSKWVPLTWEAFQDYRLDAMQLSNIEIQVLSCLAKNQNKKALNQLMKLGWLSKGRKGLKLNREAKELESKLCRLGFPIPWNND